MYSVLQQERNSRLFFDIFFVEACINCAFCILMYTKYILGCPEVIKVTMEMQVLLYISSPSPILDSLSSVVATVFVLVFATLLVINLTPIYFLGFGDGTPRSE